MKFLQLSFVVAIFLISGCNSNPTTTPLTASTPTDCPTLGAGSNVEATKVEKKKSSEDPQLAQENAGCILNELK